MYKWFNGKWQMRMLACVIGLVVAFSGGAITGQVPTNTILTIKNANGAVLSGVTYPDAFLIAFKDSASKTEMIDAFASAYGYQATINGSPNPQTKLLFAAEKLNGYLRDIYRAEQIRTAAATASATAAATADTKFPQ